MGFLNNIKVGFKIGILVCTSLVVVAVVGGIGYLYLQKSNESMSVMYEDRLIPVRLINEVRASVAQTNSAVLEIMITTDNKKKQELTKFIDANSKRSNDIFVKLEKVHLDDKGRAIFTKIQTFRDKYRSERKVAIDLALQNKNEEAYQLYTSKVQPLAAEYIANLQELSEYYSEISETMKIDNEIAANQANMITLGILLFAFIILGISGFYINKTISNPLKFMVKICKELADGDFRDKPRQVLRKDEIGMLANAMASMRDSLRELMKHVNISAEQLAASSEELTASADQSAQAAEQVAVSITDVAKGAEQQLKAAEHTSIAVEQISASIEQISANANEVAGQASQAEEEANKGNQSVGRAVSQMKSIEQTVVSSAQVVIKLGERSKEIGQIVDTISGIAGQTNLLALNAAIEAARAGEQGRGFAVVAEEVRKLAEQSQDAAKKIASLIGEIQGETEKAVTAMDEGTREVKIGAEVVHESGQVFQNIATRVNHVAIQVKEISQAIEHMAEGSQKIVASVREIDQLSKNASSESQSVSAATEEQSASMEEIASASQALAKLAMDLRSEVGKFKI